VARLTFSAVLDTPVSGDGKQTVAFDRGGGLGDVGRTLAINDFGRIVVVSSGGSREDGICQSSSRHGMARGQTSWLW
jgi:hypothetical protein